jgi:hypothetical protein
MGFVKLDRQREELKRARRKRDEWIKRVKDLEQKYQESENTCIHEMVHEANVTPEQLSMLLKQLSNGVPDPEQMKAVFVEESSETGKEEEETNE